MWDDALKNITDRYGHKLKKPKEKPTVAQSLAAWWLLNELLEIGYPHNFQGERPDIKSYMYDASSLIDKALKIKEMSDEE